MHTKGLSEKQKIEIAEKAGWTCTCFSPLTLEFIDGGYATGIAAEYALNTIVENYEESEIDNYLYEVDSFTKLNYVPLKAVSVLDKMVYTLNEAYFTYHDKFISNIYSIEDIKDYKLFRVIAWTKID